MEAGAQEAPAEPPREARAVLNTYDILVVVFYFVFVLAVGIWSSLRASRSTVGGYFLAGRSMTWWPIGASLMSSNVGSGLFIGLAGTGAAGGLAVGGFEWNATWLLIALGWVFVPVYIAAGVVTMPEYLKKRFGGQRIQVYMSVLSLVLYIFTKISTDIFSGALFIQVSLGWDLYLSTIILLVVTAVYTIAGGLTAVIYTDALQTLIMVGGALVLMFLGFKEVGWYPGLQEKYSAAVANVTVPNTTCHLPRPDAFHLFRDPVTGDIPWPGLIFGLTVLATWCWCTDQVRAPSPPRGGAGLGPASRCPPGRRPLLRGCRSGAATWHNAGAPWRWGVPRSPTGCEAGPPVPGPRPCPPSPRWTPGVCSLPANLPRTRVGAPKTARSFIARCFSRAPRPPQAPRSPGPPAEGARLPLTRGHMPLRPVSHIHGHQYPPITALFLLAIFCHRVTEPGAFWGLVFGLVVGAVRMVLEFSYGAPSCGERDARPAVLRDVHYLYFALLLFGLTALVILAVSFCTPPIPEEKLIPLTWWTRHRRAPGLDGHYHGHPAGGGEAERSAPDSRAEEHVWGDGALKEECPAPTQSCWQKFYFWFCGLSSSPTPVLSPAEKAAMERKLTSIEETPLWRNICDINAIFLLAVNIFLWGYFA
ncbi:sodium/glucose cotransporter 4 [Sarcophilus harrisii]|uniref:sodium/glucose cotransporter 4 n=1 Tax=Sarcophilus harrisii TaxID=9305 RepID=UPI001301E623|nr:sodium/glucose cotransporter 4 [Sarcophilus harrisii]